MKKLNTYWTTGTDHETTKLLQMEKILINLIKLLSRIAAAL